jgi:ABC-type lipoprotein release transport system permease subunit
MIVLGIAIAMPCVWAMARLVKSELYGIQPTDPATIIVATLVLMLDGPGPALIPARRASTVNPIDALRFE